MYKLIRPLLFKIDSETVHNQMLRLAAFFNEAGLSGVVKAVYDFEHYSLENKVFGVNFKNPVGTAAGFDKSGQLIDFLPALGFSHVQVGDTSAQARPGNPKPRLFRLVKDNALINRMGQNNKGADYIASLLEGRKFSASLFLSMVKTPDPKILGDEAVEDFLYTFRKLHPLGDVSVINISCPNTEEGKTFEEPESLKVLLGEISKARLEININKPILVKISPDISFEKLDTVLEICEAHKIDGYILTNTAQFRTGLLTDPLIVSGIGKGGLSGKPLRERSTQLVRHAYKQLKRPCIIGLGGIDSAEAAYEKIKAGASLIQLYTGLIYEGPELVKKINKGLVKLLERDGFKNITEAVGVEAK
jgi:dihydroorotate dehydrogenase